METETNEIDLWITNNGSDEELEKLMQETKKLPSDEMPNYQYIESADQLRFGGKELTPHTLQRVRTVMNLLIEGFSPQNIMQKHGAEWNVSMGSIHNYSVVARKLIAKELLTKDTDIRNDMLAKYNNLYKQLYAQNKLIACKEVLDSIVKLTQKVQIDLTSNGEPISTIRLIEVAGTSGITEIPITPHTEE